MAERKCPRAGWIVCYADSWKLGRPVPAIGKETSCHQYQCRVCGPKRGAYVGLRAEVGCLMVGRSWFITLTFRRRRGSRPLSETEARTEDRSWARLGVQRGMPLNAGGVSVAWRRFLSRLQELQIPMRWMKVVELTKKGQPHLHLLMNGIGTWESICKLPNWTFDSWRHNTCQCLLHVISKLWYKATKGDSWITDARPIKSARGISVYLSKYLVKAFDNRTKMENLGFTKRYSSSAKWGGERRRMVGTLNDEWVHQHKIPDYRLMGPLHYTTGHPAQESYADQASEIIYRRRNRARLLNKKYGSEQ